ncbi:MAG: ERF family protein [Gemmatimonadales bacterium]
MKNISAKMVKAMDSIDAVVKRGRNQNQQYDYVKATDVANEVRQVLHENGIAFAYEVESIDHWVKDKFDKEAGMPMTAMFFCQIKVKGTFTDMESGESVSGNSVGWGADPLDKAPYKAMTGALKYLLRMMFLIPDESDPENDNGGNTFTRTETQRASRPPANHDAEPPNDYDAHMDQTAQPRIGPPVDPKHTKVLYAIAMGKKWATAEYRQWINRQGFSKDADIPMARFQEIKQKLEAA